MRNIFYLVVLLLGVTSCNYLNPSIMLKTDKSYVYDTLKDSAMVKEYRISPNDMIDFRIYTNDGFMLVDLTTLSDRNITAFREDRTYVVEHDGYVKLPVIGRTYLQGLTVRQAEMTLEEKYSAYYIKPFVLLRVVNKRVIVFPGSPGAAKVITLQNNNTTLMETLALSGGISQNGKAYKIKVIRGYDSKDPQVYLVDLSTIAGLDKAGMVMQANDIVYVEPRRYFSREILGEISPVLSIVTSLLLAYGLIIRSTN